MYTRKSPIFLLILAAAAFVFAVAGCGGGNPSKSPDPPGPFKIIFYSNRNETPGMYKMDADGSNVELVLAGSYGMAVLSHDHRRIAYPQGGDIKIIDLDGNLLTTLDPEDDVTWVNWSPGDDALVVANNYRGIFTIDAATGATLTAKFTGDYPDWGPDGIVYDSSGVLCMRVPSGTSDVLLKHDGEEIRGGFPSWSPTGDRISYLDMGTARALKVINAADGALICEVPGYILFNNIWTPDGQYVIYTLNSNIYSVNVDDGTVVNITNMQKKLDRKSVV